MAKLYYGIVSGSDYVAPIYTLPTFCTYDAATDTVKATGFDTSYSEVGLSLYNGGTPIANSGVRATNEAALQAAINSCAASSNGWVIKVTAGGDYGAIELKARPSNAAGWIYVRPDDTAYAALPSPSAGTTSGTQTNRVAPSDASHMFRLATHTYVDNIALHIPITTNSPYLCKYRLIGMEVIDATGAGQELIRLNQQAWRADVSLTMHASDPTKIAPTGGTSAGDVGQAFYLMESTGFTLGHYQITAQDGTYWTVDRACGTTGATGGNGSAMPYNANTANMPHNIVFDRCYIHGTYAGTGTASGLCAEAQWVAVLDSWIADIGDGRISEPKSIRSISGKYLKYCNCYINGGGILSLVGGSVPAIADPYLPGDMLWDRCHFDRPEIWNPYHPNYTTSKPLPKNHWEVKFGSRYCVQDCVIEDTWAPGAVNQNMIVNIKTESTWNPGVKQTPWATTTDVTFRHVLVAGHGGGIDCNGITELPVNDYEAQRTNRLDFVNVVVTGGRNQDYTEGTLYNWRNGFRINRIKTIRLNRVTIVSPGGTEGYASSFYVAAEGTEEVDSLTLTDVLIAGVHTSGWGLVVGMLDGSYCDYRTVIGSLIGTGNAVVVEHNPSGGEVAAWSDLNTAQDAVIVGNSSPSAMVSSLSPLAPEAGNYTVVLPALATANTAGTGPPGARWDHLSARLTGVRENVS